MKGGAASRQRRFDGLLRSIGREREITSLARESAYSLGRLLTFLTHAANERKEDELLKSRIRTAARDVQSLTTTSVFFRARLFSCSPRSAWSTSSKTTSSRSFLMVLSALLLEVGIF
jgi:magnesium transporter